MTADTATVGLREMREGVGRTLEETALISRLSVPFLSRVERGERHLSPDARVRVMRALGLTLDQARQVRELADDGGAP